LSDEHVEGLKEIVVEEDLALRILKAAKSSMGMDTSEADMLNIIMFTDRMVSLALYRKQLFAYLEEKMSTVAPNLSALIGETVAARLIQKAGSLTSLAKCPASTVQILGAEKALFRALKTKGNTPKYGLIYHSSFIGRASAKNKGRISRYLVLIPSSMSQQVLLVNSCVTKLKKD
jgi:nucleolar protein 56